jgi:hypothetical protein
MKFVKPRAFVLVILAGSFLMVSGSSYASGQTISQRPPLISFDGTTPNDVANTLNLDERMTLLKQDYDYCTKIGLTNPDMSDKCREFQTTI